MEYNKIRTIAIQFTNWFEDNYWDIKNKKRPDNELFDKFYKEALAKGLIEDICTIKNVIKSVYCDCKEPMNGVDNKGIKYCKICDRDFEHQQI